MLRSPYLGPFGSGPLRGPFNGDTNAIVSTLQTDALALYSQPGYAKTGGGTLAANEIEFLITPSNGSATTFRIYRHASGDPVTQGLGSYTDISASGNAQVVGLTVAPLYGSMYYRVRAFDANGNGSEYSALYKFTSPCFVYDTFTDSDKLLSVHTGEFGATWTRHGFYTGTTLSIASNAIKTDGTAYTQYYASGTPPRNCEVRMNWTKSGVTGAGNAVLALFRLQPGANTFYQVGWLDTISGLESWGCYKIGGGGGPIGTAVTTNLPSVGVHDMRITAEENESGHLVFKIFNDGVLVFTGTDTVPLSNTGAAVGCNIYDEHANDSNRINSFAAYGLPVRNYQTVGGKSSLIILPQNYDATTGHDVIMYHSGSGEDYTAWDSDSLKTATRDALLGAGYILCGISAGTTAWGNQASQDCYLPLWTYADANFSANRLLFLSQSMGGLTGLGCLARQDMPVIGWYGIYPVCSLLAAYNHATFTAAVKTAYGIAGDGSDYASKTSGYDPVLKSASAYPVVRMRTTASNADTYVPRGSHSDVLQTLLASRAREFTILAATGDHGDLSHFVTSDSRQFFARCLNG
jgi:hypothetical protein